MLHQDDAAKIFRLEGPTGIRVRLKDLHQAREVALELSRTLSGDLLIRDWTRQNKTWFAAVQLEKRMCGVPCVWMLVSVLMPQASCSRNHSGRKQSPPSPAETAQKR